MAYNDMKEFNGKKYSGMRVGGRHAWNYPNGTWKEEKVAPDKWVFTFSSTKRRKMTAPKDSGAPKDTQFHWYILADQRVRKIDKDTYETTMVGVKYKVAHKRPHWRKWSCEYPDNVSDKERRIAILRHTLKELENECISEEM